MSQTTERPRLAGPLQYIHVAQRVFNSPLAIDPAKLQVILQVLESRMGFEAPQLVAGDLRGADVVRSTVYGGQIVEGIRTIQIDGTLVNRYATAPSGAISYDELRDEMAAAANDPRVRAVMLRIGHTHD